MSASTPEQLITYPPRLGVLVRDRGPREIKELVERAGGISAAARIGGVSRWTFTRWLDASEEPALSWAGYPSPLSLLDRLCLEAGCAGGFLGELERREQGALTRWRREERLGLSAIDVEASQLVCAAVQLRVPTRRLYRWMAGVRYPRSWRALDDLSLELRGRLWIPLLLLSEKQPPLPHRAPRAAISAFVRDFL